jgi:hypothetical protein
LSILTGIFGMLALFAVEIIAGMLGGCIVIFSGVLYSCLTANPGGWYWFNPLGHAPANIAAGVLGALIGVAVGGPTKGWRRRWVIVALAAGALGGLASLVLYCAIMRSFFDFQLGAA